MKRITILLFALAAVLTAGSALAETVEGLPVHIQKFDTGAMRIWVGDHISSTGIVAIPTKKGIVVVDNAGLPKVDKKLRKIIARELGRDDFKVLINTHEHGDHTGGNGVYQDCMIVGHELVAAGMQPDGEHEERVMEWRHERIANLKTEIAAAAAGSAERTKLEEELVWAKLLLEDAEQKRKPVVPTKTFSDRMKLNMGDTVIEMFYIGGMHSSSDIAVLVPTHGLLMTGDTMADTWLTEAPGCLASFAVRSGVEHDFPKLLKNWQALLDRKDEIQHLLPGHWDGELSFAGFEARVAYVEQMWKGANDAVKNNTNLDGLMAEYGFQARFPELVNSPGCNAQNHYGSLIELWSTVSGQQAAGQVLFDLINDGADQKEIDKVVAQFGKENADCFFIESQINGFGYRFMFFERPTEAAKLFRINAQLYPDSWNVYDSLGEALLAAGEQDEAIAMYEKSLEINPDSQSGKDALARIRGEVVAN